MQWLDDVMTQMRGSDRVLVERLGPPGQPSETWTYGQVLDAAIALAAVISHSAGDADEYSVGVVAENSVAWVVADLACLLAGVCAVPVPFAFSSDQARHLLAPAQICLVDAPGQERLSLWGAGVLAPQAQIISVDTDELAERGHGLEAPQARGGDWICKAIHTSGTTSAPKGVRIRAAGLSTQITALGARVPAGSWQRYLSVVPLSLLIEQITACYLTLAHRGTVVFLPRQLRLLGTAPDAISPVADALANAQPTALQGPPALYEALSARADAHPDDDPAALVHRLFGTDTAPFLACGGAPIAPAVLENLRERGIAVYEGYGLSENTSVVAWNGPGALRPGSVGLPLEHVQVRLEPSGELAISSTSLFAGYTTDDPSSCHVTEDGWLRTGDLAEIDADGYLYIRGRIKNVFITAAGRNIAPDWVASQYRTLPQIQDAVIFADGADEVAGFFVIADGHDLDAARAAVAACGHERLSGIDAVTRAVLVPVADPRIRELFTVTGRPIRHKIEPLLDHAAALT